MKPAEELPSAPAQRVAAQVGFVVLGLAALINLGALWMAESSYDALQSVVREAALEDRTIAAIDQLRIHLLDAETGQRGYVVTGDAEYLQPYHDAQRALPGDFETLQQLVGGDAVQASQLATVRRIADERMAEIAATIDARRSGGFDVALAVIMSHGGKVAMDTLRAALDGMRAAESTARSGRTDALERHRRAIRRSFYVEAALNLLLVTLGALMLWREIGRLRREREAMAQRGATLEAEVRERTAQLTELSRFQEHVREDEKKRVARELHDELGGTLTAAKIDLQLISDRLKTDPAIGPRLTRISAALDDAIAVKRRIIEDLRPTLLDNLGISAALRWQCDEFAKRSGCVCTASCPDGEEQPLPEQSVALYRIVQEALAGIGNHARATRVDVDLMRDDDQWRLTVRDDGSVPADRPRSRSHGLVAIRERARTLGGDVVLTTVPEGGSILDVSLPIEPPAAGFERE